MVVLVRLDLIYPELPEHSVFAPRCVEITVRAQARIGTGFPHRFQVSLALLPLYDGDVFLSFVSTLLVSLFFFSTYATLFSNCVYGPHISEDPRFACRGAYECVMLSSSLLTNPVPH